MTDTLKRATTFYHHQPFGDIKPSEIIDFKALHIRNSTTFQMKSGCLFAIKKRICVPPKTLTNAWRFIVSVLRNENIVPPKISLPQVSPNERPFLEPDQIKQFVNAVEGTDIEIPALLALSSLRRSEICALRWENIDLKKQRILVKGAAVYDQHQKLVQKKENKNRISARYVPIMMKELLIALNREQKPTGLVVQCAPNTIRARINRICEANHLPLVGVHGLRHPYVKPTTKNKTLKTEQIPSHQVN